VTTTTPVTLVAIVAERAAATIRALTTTEARTPIAAI
jgi:hypothetical protein